MCCIPSEGRGGQPFPSTGMQRIGSKPDSQYDNDPGGAHALNDSAAHRSYFLQPDIHEQQTGTPEKLSAAAVSSGSRIHVDRWSNTASDHMRLPSSRSWNSVSFMYTCEWGEHGETTSGVSRP